MKEQLISFDTAKLAKEIGFDIPCLQAYRVWRENVRKSDSNPLEEIQTEWEGHNYFVVREFYQSKEHTLAPTQSLLQKWLRKIHKISVLPYQPDCTKKYHGCSIKWFDNVYREQICSGKDYEEALEKGLQEALKLIKL